MKFPSGDFMSPMGLSVRRALSVSVALLAACCPDVVTGGVLAQQRHGAFLGLREQVDEQSGTMEALYPFYHSTENIQSELAALAKRCDGLTLEAVEGTSDDGESRSIDVVTFVAPGTKPTNKNFFLFGEHSRELISPESGLHFVKSLCGETPLAEKAREITKDNEFQIVVNGNPLSRVKVEGGDFCLRTNPDGVDLNRNWDEEWAPNAIMDAKDTNPGPKPFSEPETRVFKQLVENYKPTTFLTVHSGTKGMYMPWAYDTENLAKRNKVEMMKILKAVDKDHCQCPFGAAGKEVGYACPGTCLDWVYDKLKAQYAFAFEIYTSSEQDDSLRERWQEKMQSQVFEALQTDSHLGHDHFKDIFAAHPSSFVQLKAESRRSGYPDDPQICFEQFNPGNEEEYKRVIENWSGAYLDMASMVAVNLLAKNGTAF